LFQARGITLEEVTVTGTADIFQAAQAAVARGIDAMWITGDNTAYQGFDSLVKVTRDAHLPLFIDDPVFVERGAVAAVGVGWHEAGRAAAPIIKRVLGGESPQGIPFQNVAIKQLVLNQEVARTLGITFPADLVVEAAKGAAAAGAAVQSP
jgi:putative ABC transport system substrate-binding protein